jgi:hypothetical protein
MARRVLSLSPTNGKIEEFNRLLLLSASIAIVETVKRIPNSSAQNRQGDSNAQNVDQVAKKAMQ